MESRRESFNCSKCVYSTKRSYNLKRHILSEHIADRNSSVPIETANGFPKRPRIQEADDDVYIEKEHEESMDTLNRSTQLCDRLPKRQPRVEPENGLYSKQEFQECMSNLQTRFPTMKLDTIDPRFMHPFTAIIAGPSSSGKSMFCMRLIRNAKECIAPPPERIVYCYSVYQPLFDQFPDVEFVEGLPDLNMFDGVKRTLLIIDDLMHETNETVSKLFTRVSHHKNASVVYLTQNLFNNNKHNRTISLNAHYIILFKNVRDATQVQCLARQMFPRKSEAMMQGYKDATGKPYGYLLVDLTQPMDDRYRLRTKIFPGEDGEVYVPM